MWGRKIASQGNPDHTTSRSATHVQDQRRPFSAGAMSKVKVPFKRSRTARRATSPSFSRDKCPAHTASPSVDRPSVLAVHRSAGVQKKSRAIRHSRLSAKARRRHERDIAMAKAVSERTSLKKERSIGRAHAVQARRKGWADINKDALAVGERQASNNAFDALAEDSDDAQDCSTRQETFFELGNEDTVVVDEPATTMQQKTAAEVLPPDDDGDEIL